MSTSTSLSMLIGMTMGDPAVTLAPILRADLPEVAAFLHRDLNHRLSAADWERSIVPAWPGRTPNHGFHLRHKGEVVGAALAFYSERAIGGRTEKVCNLGAWCVVEGHRSQGLRLLRALLGQQGYHFTDLSPSGAVVRLNERLKFEHLDTTTWVVANLPRPGNRVRVVVDPGQIAARLTGRDLEIYSDHRAANATRHVVLEVEERHVHVIFRKDRRKGVPVFATLLHVSDPSLLPAVWTRLATHLLLRHGAVATLVERRVLDWRPAMAVELARPRPKMFRSKSLRAADIDYLYSELTCVAW